MRPAIATPVQARFHILQKSPIGAVKLSRGDLKRLQVQCPRHDPLPRSRRAAALLPANWNMPCEGLHPDLHDGHILVLNRLDGGADLGHHVPGTLARTGELSDIEGGVRHCQVAG